MGRESRQPVMFDDVTMCVYYVNGIRLKFGIRSSIAA